MNGPGIGGRFAPGLARTSGRFRSQPEAQSARRAIGAEGGCWSTSIAMINQSHRERLFRTPGCLSGHPRSGRRQIPGRALAVLSAAVALCAPSAARATLIDKANNTTALNDPASWTTTVPGSSDIAQWTSTVTAANTTVLGASLAWDGIKIVGPGGAVVINSGNTLTLGASGIDLTTATQNLTLNPTMVLSNTQTFDVATGRTLALGTTATVNNGGFNLTLAGAGTKTMGGVISGAGAISITGGTATLTAANTFGGGVTLASGATLNLTAAGSGGTSSSLGTGTLTINGGTIAPTASITLSTNNVQSWNGDFALGGTLNLNFGTGAVTMSATRTVTVAGSGTYTVGGVIGGAGFSLNTANTAATITGTLVLNGNGATAYSGGTNINGGVVRFGAGAIPATGSIVVGDTGALGVAGAYTTLAGWLGDSRLSTASTGTLALTADSSESFGFGSYTSLSLGAAVGVTAIYTGTYTPTGSTYRVGGGGGTIKFSGANTFVAGNSLVVDNGGGGTVVISNSNTLNGGVTVSSGTLQIGDVGTAGALDSSTGISIASGATLAFNRTDTVTFAVPTSGAGTLVQRGSGTLLLTAPAGTIAHTGGTTISTGTLRIGATNTLPTTGTVTVGSGTTAGTLDLVNFDQSIATLLSLTNSTTAVNSISIAAGRTLTVTSGVTIGPDLGSTTKLNVTGAGRFFVNAPTGRFQVGGAATAGAGNAATVDMSGLTTFDANVATFRVGDFDGTQTSNGASTTILATNNSITATSLEMYSGRTGSQTMALKLGSGTNQLNADTIIVGLGPQRSSGSLTFNVANGSMTIRAKDGSGRAALNVVAGTSGTSETPTGTVDLRGHDSNLLVSTLAIGGRSGSNGANGAATGLFHFDTGTLDANGVTIGTKTGGSSTGTISGTLNIGGGTVKIGSGGILLGNNTTTSGAASATIALTGGVTTLAGDIKRGTGTGTLTSSFTLDGGTLDMGGFNLGSANLIGTLNLQTGLLKNVAQINNGQGLTKTTGSGANTLELAGTNAYTGPTTVSAGKLLVSGSLTGTTSVSVANGATLGGSGGVIGATATAVTVNAGGTLAPGASIGTLTVGTTGTGNSVSLVGASGNNAVFAVELDAPSNSSDLLVVKGNLDLSGAFDSLTTTVLNGTSPAGTYTIASYAGTLTGTFDSLSLPSGYQINYGTLTNGVITLAPIPEPSGMACVAIASAGLALRRKRRRG